MDKSQPKIRLEHLIKIYGKAPHAALKQLRLGQSRDAIQQSTGHVVGVNDVSLSINAGELFVVMGLSGSGKSTLVRCINRLIQPTSGHLYLDDEDIAQVSEQRMRAIRLAKVSMVFQRFGLFPHKTVAENVAYGLKVQGLKQAQRHPKVRETLAAVGLADWADYRPAALSGGMQQRVGLARALATDAEILLMDEPFSALDPLIRREMQDELLRLQTDLHKTIVFISHDIHEALKLGDRIAVMKEGAIVQMGTPEALITQPVNGYIRAFTQDINRAQVLTAGAIARPVTPWVLGQLSVSAALAQWEHNGPRYMVDSAGKLLGILDKTSLDLAAQQGQEDLSQGLQTAVPQVRASTPLDQTLHLYQQGGGGAIAVVDHTGQLLGRLDLADVLGTMEPPQLTTRYPPV